MNVSPGAIVLVLSILSGIGAGSFLMIKEGNSRKDWIIVGIGVLLGIIAAILGTADVLGWTAERMMKYLPVIPIPFAMAFLYLNRDYYGGEISRYFEVITIGLGINFLMYVPHLFWHFQGQTGGALPSLGLNPSFWYAFFHGMSALGFMFIAYGFNLFYKSIEE